MRAIFKKQAGWDARKNRLASAMALNIGAAPQTTPGPPPEVPPDSAPEIPTPTPTTVPPPDHSPDPNSAPQPHAVIKRIVELGEHPIITIRSVIIANSRSALSQTLELI